MRLSILSIYAVHIKGSHSPGVPPLPIPNREAKPGHADGTAQAGEQGAAHFHERVPVRLYAPRGLSFFYAFPGRGVYYGLAVVESSQCRMGYRNKSQYVNAF